MEAEEEPDLPARDTFDLQRRASRLSTNSNVNASTSSRPQLPSRPLPDPAANPSPRSSVSELARSFSMLSTRSSKRESEAWKLTEQLPEYTD